MFDSLRDLVDGILDHGELIRTEKIGEFEFKIKPLTTEEMIIANSINTLKEIKENNKSDDMEAFNDVFSTTRSINSASFYIVEMNGIKIHDPSDTGEEKIRKAKELRKILIKLPPATLIKLSDVYQSVVKERNRLLEDDIEETVGK